MFKGFFQSRWQQVDLSIPENKKVGNNHQSHPYLMSALLLHNDNDHWPPARWKVLFSSRRQRWATAFGTNQCLHVPENSTIYRADEGHGVFQATIYNKTLAAFPQCNMVTNGLSWESIYTCSEGGCKQWNVKKMLIFCKPTNKTKWNQMSRGGNPLRDSCSIGKVDVA